MIKFNRNSLSYKTTLIYIVMGVIIISIFNFIIWENQSDLIIENQKLVVESISQKLQKLVRSHSQELSYDKDINVYEKMAKEAVNKGIIQTVVYSEGGTVIYKQQGETLKQDYSDIELVLINRCIVRYEIENKQFLHRTDVSRSVLVLYIPSPLPGSSELVVTKFTLPLFELAKKRDEVLLICFIVALVVAALQLLMALFLSRIIISPITKLVQMTKKVSQGDLTQHITLKQEDEIGILANAYNDMVVNLDKMQKEAKGANPLSGLPGNLAIMRNIDDRLKVKAETAIIYGDLDNFKAYNDTYGLNKGDEAILHCRDVFLTGAKEDGDPSTFVGHEGGDDFVIVTSFATWENLCKKIIAEFDKGVPRFYSEEHVRQGFIDAKDRQGNAVRYPLMSLSLAVVSNHFRSAEDHRILIAWAGEMKKVVKKMPGSAYAIDKRRC
ncbi:MAG: HAMP domain-containing protein [Fibrobacteria bacterium]|nr:HAMP domain-containing protein [Fibrobacteria bacterium]